MSSKAFDYKPAVDLAESQTQLENKPTENQASSFPVGGVTAEDPFPQNSGNLKVFGSSHGSPIFLIAGGTLRELSGQSHTGRRGL